MIIVQKKNATPWFFLLWTMADKCDVSRYHSQIVFHFDNAKNNFSFLFTEEGIEDQKKGHDKREPFFFRSQMTKGCRWQRPFQMTKSINILRLPFLHVLSIPRPLSIVREPFERLGFCPSKNGSYGKNTKLNWRENGVGKAIGKNMTSTPQKITLNACTSFFRVCLKGTTLLFYPCESKEGQSVEATPRHLIIVDGSIMQAIPEHPKRDFIFCLSTAFGDAYLFQVRTVLQF